MKIGVLGATGYVGGRLIPHMLDAGHEVVCISRNPARLASSPWSERVEARRGDVLDADGLAAAFEGRDAVYYLVHAMGTSENFTDADRTGARNTARSAAAAGVGRIIYLGGLGGDDTGESGPQHLSAHLSSRHEVGAELAGGSVPVVELRAAVIIGSGSASFEMLRHLVEVLPAMVCPRWVTETRCQPIAIADVLRYLAAAAELPAASPAARHQIFEIGGPDVVSYRDMMSAYARCAGLRRRVVVPVPVLTPRLSSHWVKLVTPLPYGLARPLVDSLVNDVVVTPERDIANAVEHAPLTLDEALARALQHVADLDVRTSWADSAPQRTPASPMPQDPRWAGGTVLSDEREASVDASIDDVFATVAGIGGDRGWYSAHWLWQMRGAVDTLIGGVGMRRGRRHPDELRVGDAVDFFRVDACDPPTLLRLRAEMRLPGDAWLEWQLRETGDGVRLRQRARFHPRGVLGRLYWWALVPFHAVIFRQQISRLASAAEARDAPAGQDQPDQGRKAIGRDRS